MIYRIDHTLDAGRAYNDSDASPIYPLDGGQCFGFLPPLALGGDLDLDHVQKVGPQEHLHFLGELV